MLIYYKIMARRFSDETKQKLREQKLGEKNPNWNGGRIYDRKNDRIWIHKPEHPHANQRGYVQEHRLVVEKALGRHLRPNEIIHHVNEEKTDNRIENLQVMTQAQHLALHRRQNYTCKIIGCGKTHRAKGLCAVHYNKEYGYGGYSRV